MKALHSIPREGQTKTRGRKRTLPVLTEDEKRGIAALLYQGYEIRLQRYQAHPEWNRVQFRRAGYYDWSRPRYHNVSLSWFQRLIDDTQSLEYEWDWDKVKVKWND